MSKRRAHKIWKILFGVILLWFILFFAFGLFVPRNFDKKYPVLEYRVKEKPLSCPSYSKTKNPTTESDLNVTSYIHTFPTRLSPAFDSSATNGATNRKDQIRVLVFLHVYKMDRVRALESTWVGDLRKHYPNVKVLTFSSKLSDPKHVSYRSKQGSDVPKLKEIIKHIIDKHNDYDWFVKFDDDTFVYSHRLMDFIANTLDPQFSGKDEPCLAGFRGVYHKFQHVCGGAGYIFNKAALDKVSNCPAKTGGMYSGAEDVFISHWMNVECKIPIYFHSALLLAWPEIIIKEMDVKKFNDNNFPLDLPVSFHYIVPFEMLNFFTMQRAVPKIIYTFEENLEALAEEKKMELKEPGAESPPKKEEKKEKKEKNCVSLIHELQTKRTLEELKRLEELKKGEKEEEEEKGEKVEEIAKKDEEISNKDEEENEEPEISLEEKIEKYRNSPFQIKHLDSESVLEITKARFPDLIKDYKKHLFMKSVNSTIITTPLLKYSVLYNTGGIWISPKLKCLFKNLKKFEEEILVSAFRNKIDTVVYIDQRVDEVMFVAAVERSDSLLLMIRDSLYEDKFEGFNFGEKYFQRMYYWYGKYVEDRILMLRNVNSYFHCKE